MSDEQQPVTAVFSTVPLWPIHHAETIELVHRAVDEGHKVIFVSCDGGLAGCAANHLHREELCRICRIQTRRTEQRLLPPGVEHLRLDLSAQQASGATLEIRDRASLLAFRHHGAPIGFFVLSQIANEKKDYLVDISNEPHLSRSRLLAQNACALYDAVLSLSLRNGVSRGFVWNGRRAADGPILHALLASGASAQTFITGGALNSVFVARGSTIHEGMSELQDWAAPASRETRTQAESAGLSYLEDYRMNRVATRDFRAFGQNVAADPVPTWPIARDGRERCLLLVSSATETMAVEGAMQFFADEPYGWIQRLSENPEFLRNFSTVVKWHPNQKNVGPNEARHIEHVTDQSPAFFHISPADEGTDAYGLAVAADIVISTGSTVSYWAAARGIRTILVRPMTDRFTAASMEHFPSVGALLEELVPGRQPKPPNGARLIGNYLATRGTPMLFVDASADGTERLIRCANESPLDRPIPLRGRYLRYRWWWYKSGKPLRKLPPRTLALTKGAIRRAKRSLGLSA